MAATAALLVRGAHGKHRRRLIDDGDLVSNDPFRERFLWLSAHDPDFTLRTVCERLAAEGYPTYIRSRSGRRQQDTTRLQRNLGLRPQSPSSVGRRKGGEGWITTHVPYEFAVALCRALEMDPVDCGV